MPYADPIKGIACVKNYKEKVISRRKNMLSVFSCISCGCSDPSVIQWHHVDPQTKELDIYRTAWAEDKFWNEVLKCVPLCANCHIKIHKNLLCLIPQKTK